MGQGFMTAKAKTSSRWTLYILRCADGSFYTGITNDLEKRLKAHHNGTGAKYTRGRGPLEVLHTQHHRSKSMALKKELQIKSLTRPEKLAFMAKAAARRALKTTA